jgi:hypothetical protein
MHAKQIAILVFIASGLVLGCEKHPVENASQSPPAAVSQAAPPAATASPTVDTSLPSLEAASVKPKTGTDASTGSTLTQTERDTKMPLPGQVNDHSSPAAAKRGNTTEPVKPAK